MAWIWGFLGGFIGLLIGIAFDGGFGSVVAALVGAFIGVLNARQSELASRLQRAERQLDDLWSTRAAAEIDTDLARATATAAAPPSPPVAANRSAWSTPAPLSDVSAIDLGAVPRAPAPPPAPGEAPAAMRLPAIERSERTAARPASAAQDTESVFDTALGAIKRWFTEGNMPVKVGMVILFVGIAGLLKLAADEGWFTLPIEFRLAGVALAAIAALAFGWRQREQRRSFALSLQGGAIGVMLLTVFAAFRLYALISPFAAFALMLVLVAGVCVLAVLQNARALAVLGILAGFSAPILISTDSGDHVALFSYYALLNVAIFAIAWTRSWRALNLLGFFFTFAIGTAWGVLRYQPELRASTVPFLLLYFAIYLIIPILHALRRPADSVDRTDGTLVFGNPLFSFLLLSALYVNESTTLAFSALALGIVYLMLAAALMRRVRVLGESFAILAIAFVTLAVPIGMSALLTTCVFAIEGAALVWLGLRQQRRLPQWTGLLLQVVAGVAYAVMTPSATSESLVFANGAFVGAMLIAFAAFATALMYQRTTGHRAVAAIAYVWGLLWWCGGLLAEIERHVPAPLRIEALVVSAAATLWLLAEADRRLREFALAAVAVGAIWVVVLLELLMLDRTPSVSLWTFAAFAVVAAFGWRALVCSRAGHAGVLAGMHLGWLWAFTVLAMVALRALAIELGLGDGWRIAALGLPLIAMLLLALRAPRVIAPPLAAEFAHHRGAFVLSLAGLLVIGFVNSLFVSGGSQPLPFVPILNPLELIQLTALVVFGLWCSDVDAPHDVRRLRPLLLAAAGFAFVTSATLRASHHLAGLPWNETVITSNVSQTGLAVVWSLLGVVGWVIGSRRGNRALWMAAAVLMAVVLAKLLLFDRQHLGNIFGIASFIAYGLLCTLIGYLAPAPPRAGDEPAERAA